MKTTLILAFLYLISAEGRKNTKTCMEYLFSIEDVKAVEKPDSLFTLDLIEKGNSVRILGPKGSDFSLPEGGDTVSIYKKGDFNADGKKDIMVSLGACGTGGCMYALFLNQSGRKYNMAFYEYLKNPVFKIEKDGLWTIKSYEGIEPYNPSKLHVSVYKYNPKKMNYGLHKTFVQLDE